jgi:hypothetical protein
VNNYSERILGAALFAIYSGVILGIGMKEYLVFLTAFAWAQIIIALFNSKRWYLRLVAVIYSMNLLFLFFLPKHLKEGIKELKGR